jgi:hypothetical protein
MAPVFGLLRHRERKEVNQGGDTRDNGRSLKKKLKDFG